MVRRGCAISGILFFRRLTARFARRMFIFAPAGFFSALTGSVLAGCFSWPSRIFFRPRWKRVRRMFFLAQADFLPPSLGACSKASSLAVRSAPFERIP